MLTNLFKSDPALVVLDYVTIRDIFAIAFTGKVIRDSIIKYTRKWKYIRGRAMSGLLTFLGDDNDVMKILIACRGFISGSLALCIILGETWQDMDIDMYAPNIVACDAAHEVCPWYQYKFQRECDHSPYSINRYTKVLEKDWRGPGKSLDIMDAKIGDPNDFYMTMVQNWLWFDGRLKVLDPWAIIYRRQKFTNLCKREVLAQATMVMAINNRRSNVSLSSLLRKDEAGWPLAKRLDLLEQRVIKYEARGFTLSNDLFCLCHRFPELHQLLQKRFSYLASQSGMEL